MKMQCVLLIFALWAACVYGCTQYPAGIRSVDPVTTEPDELKVFYSQYVVYGEVVESTAPPPGIVAVDGVDTIQFNIICMYKGTPQPKRIKIYGVGNKRNQLEGCPASDLAPGDNVIIFLKRRPDHYFEVEFAPLLGISEVTLDDLTLVCGLNLTFPTDLSKAEQDPEMVCLPPLGVEDTCMQFDPPTTEKPAVTPKQIETDDDSGYDTNKGGQTGKVGDPDSGSTRSTVSPLMLLLAPLVFTIL